MSQNRTSFIPHAFQNHEQHCIVVPFALDNSPQALRFFSYDFSNGLALRTTIRTCRSVTTYLATRLRSVQYILDLRVQSSSVSAVRLDLVLNRVLFCQLLLWPGNSHSVASTWRSDIWTTAPTAQSIRRHTHRLGRSQILVLGRSTRVEMGLLSGDDRPGCCCAERVFAYCSRIHGEVPSIPLCCHRLLLLMNGVQLRMYDE